MRSLLLLLFLKLASSSSKKDEQCKFDNMNGKYVLSSTPGQPTNVSFPTRWCEYPSNGVEYFEVMHGPIKSLYSQVFWTSMSNDIPQEVVERFKDSAIAIVGLEMDQVRVDENGNEIASVRGLNHPSHVYLFIHTLEHRYPSP